MIRKYSHGKAFVDAVNAGVFSEEQIGAYLVDITKRAIYFESPIKANSTISAFGGSIEELGNYVETYIAMGLVNKKVLPFDYLACIEDDFSAVFIENHPVQKSTIILTTFKDTKEDEGTDFKGILCFGVLELVDHDKRTNLFGIHNLYGAIITEDSLELLDGNDLQLSAIDLVNSASTVIEELGYLEKDKMKP